MKPTDNNEEAGRHSGDWLDTDDEPNSAERSEIPDHQQAHVADLQVIDALLSNLSPSAHEKKEARILRVMAEINTGRPSPRAKPRRVRLKSILAVTASLVVAFGLFWAQFARESRAEVILREIGDVALENIDRVYSMRRETSASSTERETEGKLYLRGREGFLLRWGDIMAGRNRDQYWLIPQSGPVVLAEDFEWIVAESRQQAGELEVLKSLSSDSRRVPIVQLSAAVELMQDSYDIAISRRQHNGRSVDVIVGTVQEDDLSMPDKITLWADADSRIIQCFSISWGSINTIVFELMSEEDVPEDWYQHETHHDSQRGVQRISGKAL